MSRVLSYCDRWRALRTHLRDRKEWHLSMYRRWSEPVANKCEMARHLYAADVCEDAIYEMRRQGKRRRK